ncbi:MAG: hypothetical protein ACU843_14720 [Gammaproteobacteria bacterium]
MDHVAGQLPAVITAAAQSTLGVLALLSISLSLLAYFFFASASEKVRVGVFVILFLGVVGFGTAIVLAPRPPGPDPVSPLSAEAKLLLKEAVSDAAGVVTYVHYGMGSELTTNEKNLLQMTDNNPKIVASWEAALRELVNHGLLTDLGPDGDVFRVTKKGYDATGPGAMNSD